MSKEQFKVKELMVSKDETIVRLKQEILLLNRSHESGQHPTNSPAVSSGGDGKNSTGKTAGVRSHGSFRQYKRELRDKLRTTTTTTANLSTSSEDSSGVGGSPPVGPKHPGLRQTLSSPPSVIRVPVMPASEPSLLKKHHPTLKQTLSCGAVTAVTISMNRNNNTVLENRASDIGGDGNQQSQSVKSDSGRGESSENESRASSEPRLLALPPFAETQPNQKPSVLPPKPSHLNGFKLNSTGGRGSSSSSPNSSFDAASPADDSGISLITSTPSKPDCSTKPPGVKKKPMPPPRSSMTRLTTVKASAVTDESSDSKVSSQPKKSILHMTSPSDASKALDNLIHNNNSGKHGGSLKTSTLKKKVKFHPEVESSESVAPPNAKDKKDPLDTLLSQYSPKIVSRIGTAGQNRPHSDSISYFEPFI